MWETLEQDGLDVGIPSRVDDGFMREHGVGRAAHRPGQNLHENANRCKTSPPESMYLGWQKLPLRSILIITAKAKRSLQSTAWAVKALPSVVSNHRLRHRAKPSIPRKTGTLHCARPFSVTRE